MFLFHGLTLLLAAFSLTVCTSSSPTLRGLLVTIYNTSTILGVTESAGYADDSLFLYSLDDQTGQATLQTSFPAGLNASWISTNPVVSNVFYISSEVTLYKRKVQGTVAAYTLTQEEAAGSTLTWSLTLLNRVPTQPQPVRSSVSPDGKYLVVACYNPGSVELFALGPLGDVGDSLQVIQQGMGTHTVRLFGQYVFSTVLTLDKVDQYIFTKATITPNSDASALILPEGSGPRHLAFHPKLPAIVYLVNEGVNASVPCRLYVCEMSSRGTLKVIQTVSTISSTDKPKNLYPAEALVTDSGLFVYVSNRDATEKGRDTIAVFSADATTGKLTLIQEAPTQHYPRSFALSDQLASVYAGNQKANTVTGFRVDEIQGLLTPFDASTTVVCLDSPSFVMFF